MKRKKDILFLCQYFYPENNSSATLPFDTACALAAEGFSISVLCGKPKEYVVKRDAPSREIVEGISIHRVGYFQANRRTRVGRIVNFFSFTLRTLFCLPEIRNHRLIIVYSNPPILPVSAVLANKLFGNKFVFISYDVYPEIALKMDSIRKGGFIDRVMTRINRQVFRRATAVVALSDEMQTTLLRLRPELEKERTFVLPNWAHEVIQPGKKKDSGPLTVGYFGNLGVVQDTETLLSAIDRLRSDCRIQFRIVGHGSKLQSFMERMKDNPNVSVEKFMTGEDFQKALSDCDCCIVSLQNGLNGLCMPSKYYSYLQAGAAVISIMDPDSELSQEVIRERIGAAITPGNTDQLFEVLTGMADDREAVREAGMRAAILYQTRYHRNLALRRYTSVIKSIMEDV